MRRATSLSLCLICAATSAEAFTISPTTVDTQMWNLSSKSPPGLNLDEMSGASPSPIENYDVFAPNPLLDQQYVSIKQEMERNAMVYVRAKTAAQFDQLPNVQRAQALLLALDDVIGLNGGSDAVVSSGTQTSAGQDLGAIDRGQMSMFEMYKRIRDNPRNYQIFCSEVGQLLPFVLSAFGITAREWIVGNDKPVMVDGRNTGADASPLPSSEASYHGTAEYFDTASKRWIWIDAELGIAGAFSKSKNRYLDVHEWAQFVTNRKQQGGAAATFLPDGDVYLKLARFHGQGSMQACNLHADSNGRVSISAYEATCPGEYLRVENCFKHAESNFKTMVRKP